MLKRTKEMSNFEYMQLAIDLALKGKGGTSPNPLVGAVVVRQGKVVGKGYHQQAGKRHAEIVALDIADKKAKNSTLYVNLEPCATYGRTAPCTDRIIKAGVKKVVIGMLDPNPVNNGIGVKKLKANNIEVVLDVLRKEAERINKPWIKFITQGQPYVILKIAQSLDGKIATSTGDSRWITSSMARKHVHRLRREVDAILVGVNTIIKDDPILSARLSSKKLYRHQPIKVILDSSLRTPLNAKIFSRQSPAATIIATTKFASLPKIKKLEKRGVQFLFVKEKDKRVDLKTLMRKLAKMGVVQLLIEGGGEVFNSAIESRIVDEILVFIAPKIIANANKISKAFQLDDLKIVKIGGDVLLKCSPV